MLPRIFTFFLLFVSLCSPAGLFDSKPAYLTGAQAFAFSHQVSANQLALNWQIADGYYLYKKSLSVQGKNVTLGEMSDPPSEVHQDEFFGEVDIFRHQLQLTVPFSAQQSGAQVEVSYQGCTQGFCYPPETVVIALQQPGQFDANSANSPENTAKAEQVVLAEQLAENRFSLLWFFVLGLGLAFTPCVLPMLPLLSAIVIGSHQRPNSGRALLLSLSYVQGMALTYTLLGLIVAAIGLPFQVALQSPPVLIGLAVLFTLLALSMFGLFNLQLPLRWQQKLNHWSQQQQGGSLGSVFVMGMIAGLVASPCTSAPLSGALLYVAQSGDLATGGVALYLLALGMGVPLMLVTLFGNRILPKSGDWLLKVKTAFGFVMLALPVFLLTRVLPSAVEPLLWSALAIAFLVWLLAQLCIAVWWQKVLGILLLIALVLSAKPWTDWIFQPNVATPAQTTHFTRIQSVVELKAQLAANRGKAAMVDLYADWCVACKEFEKYIFSDPQVQQKLSSMLLLQIDMTHNSAENDAFMQHFQILGLPTILFFDTNGTELPSARITGFMQPQAFLTWLNSRGNLLGVLPNEPR